MTRGNKTIVITVLIISASVIIGLGLRTGIFRPGEVAPDDDLLIRQTIQNAWHIQVEAEYTFDTSKFSSVYINDPRGGDLPDEALEQIRDIRHDPSIQKDQVGILDYRIALIEKLKQGYDSYINDLRTSEVAGTITGNEKIILEGERDGWPTAAPGIVNSAQMATQACVLFQTQAISLRETTTAMPSPVFNGYSTAYPEPPTPYPLPATTTSLPGTPYPPPVETEAIYCPTSTPTAHPIDVPFGGMDPALLPPDDQRVDILSVEINGDIARAIAHIRRVTTEYTLVKIDGQWYIAGAKLVKADP